MPTIVDMLRDALGGGADAERTISQLSAGERTLLHEVLKRIDATRPDLADRIGEVERHVGSTLSTMKADIERQVRRSAKSLLTQLRKDPLPFVPGIYVQGVPCPTPHDRRRHRRSSPCRRRCPWAAEASRVASPHPSAAARTFTRSTGRLLTPIATTGKAAEAT